jgi:hypothetical protein
MAHKRVNISESNENLKPIEITPVRLARLGFASVYDQKRECFRSLTRAFISTFTGSKMTNFLLVINNEIKLPHVIYIHQLQNIYYGLVGDVLKLPV